MDEKQMTSQPTIKSDYVIDVGDEKYMKNSRGALVPVADIKESALLRHEVAVGLLSKAIEINQRLSAFRQQAEKDFSDLVEIAAEKYGVKIGGEIGNVTASLYDGSAKVMRVYSEKIEFTEEIQAAKALINICFDRWSEGSSRNMRSVFDRAFRTNKKGELKTAAVLDLFSINVEDDPEWDAAMTALKDSIQVTGMTTYFRVQTRANPNSPYVTLPLDVAGVSS